MLLSQICLAVLEHFKKQLTLAQLKEHALIEVCYSLERKELNIEKSAQQIYIYLKEAISSEKENDFPF